MSVNKVQLKQEELVDSSVVLTDINPITDTESVSDVSSGSTMKETIDRIWNAINTKLSRVVNSVNGRTGVVIIDANDVGLGNVDNVSYQEIKEWVLEQIQSMLNGKHLRLYNTLDEVAAVCATSDKMYDGVPFYTQNGETGTGDKLSYIGYYTYNEETESLSYDAYPINVVGHTDNSIIYNETVVKNSTTIDMSGGGIAVNIHPDEEALYVENAESKANSGLRIDPSKLNGGLIFSDSLYQTDGNDTQALLAYDSGSKGSEVSIYINDELVTSEKNFYLNNKLTEPIQKNTLIVTNFKWLTNPSDGLRDSVLMARQPAIGRVTSAPSKSHPNDPYIIKFYSIKPYSDKAFGIKLYETHQNSANTDTILGLDLSTASINGTSENVSGLQAFSHQPKITDPSTKSNISGISVFTPWGQKTLNNLGVHVSSDVTIASCPSRPTSPSDSTGKNPDSPYDYYGSETAINWIDPWVSTSKYEFLNPYSQFTQENGVAESPSHLVINENKLMGSVYKQGDIVGSPPYKFMNVSGLKHVYEGSHDTDIPSSYWRDKLKEYGIPDMKDATGKDINMPSGSWWTSGGIQINTGKFLEILPVDTTRAMQYYDGGKLQVRIGSGLKESITYTLTTEEPAGWNTKKAYENYVIAEQGTQLYYVNMPLVFSLLNSEPSDWTYGFINYFQKVIRGFYHEGAFYTDISYTDEITPEENQVYIDTADLVEGQWRAYVYHDPNYESIGYYDVIKEFNLDNYYIRLKAMQSSPTLPVPAIGPEFDSGVNFYSATCAAFNDIIAAGYDIYLRTSMNRIMLDIDEDSGLYLDDNGKLSYAIPVYTTGHKYHAGQLIRVNGTSVYLVHTSFTATEWHVEPGPGDEANCTLISNT